MSSHKNVGHVDCSRIGKMLITLFDHWQISTIEQLSLLGLSKDNRAALSKYRNGQSLANELMATFFAILCRSANRRIFSMTSATIQRIGLLRLNWKSPASPLGSTLLTP